MFSTVYTLVLYLNVTNYEQTVCQKPIIQLALRPLVVV